MLKSVIIPASVYKIGGCAFTGCYSLENVTFEEGSNLTSLSWAVFTSTAIKSFEIPQNVKSVDGQAFDDNKLTNLTVHPENIYLIIENGTLFSANKSIMFFVVNKTTQTYEFQESVTTIGDCCFESSKYVTLTFPESLTTIKSSSIRFCYNLVNVTFKGSYTYIDGYNFQSCPKLELIIFSNSPSVLNAYSFIDNDIPKTNITFNFKVLFYSTAIKRIANVTIPYLNEENLIINPDALIMNSIQTEIYEFYGYNYDKITIPKQIRKIRQSAFENSTIYRIDFEVDSQLYEIEDYAFRNCSKIYSFNFTTTQLNYLGFSTFKDCTNLTFVNFAATKFVVKNNLFENCNKLINISNINNISNGCFCDCIKLNKVSIQYGAEFIGISSFKNCYSLETINIPSSVRIISDYAFINCKNLSIVIFETPNSLAKISINSFSECDSLLNISDFISEKYVCTYNTIYSVNSTSIDLILHLRNSLDTFLSINCSVICKYSFNHSNNIENISITSNSVSLIEPFSFNNCQNLKFINFPMSIKSVQYQAFNDCNSIQCPIIIENTSPKFINMLVKSGIPRSLINSCVVINDSNNIPRFKRICNTAPILFWQQLSK